MNGRLEARLRRLEVRLQPELIPAFIVGPRLQDRPQALNPGERVVVDYTDGRLVTWCWRITTDPNDHGRQEPDTDGYIAECLRRRAAGESCPLPWEEDGADPAVGFRLSYPIDCRERVDEKSTDAPPGAAGEHCA